MLNEILNLQILYTLFNIGFTVVVAIIIGYNREATSQAAGIKTHVLVALGGLLSIMIPIDSLIEYHNYTTFDPYRLSGQVITGIGFLGAGTIIRTGYSVKGLTTSASLWLVAIFGIGIGARAYELVLVTFIITLFILRYLRFFLETKKFQTKRILITYYYTDENAINLNEVFTILGVSKNSEKIIRNKKIETNLVQSKVLVELKYHKHKIDVNKLMNTLISKEYIVSIEDITDSGRL